MNSSDHSLQNIKTKVRNPRVVALIVAFTLPMVGAVSCKPSVDNVEIHTSKTEVHDKLAATLNENNPPMDSNQDKNEVAYRAWGYSLAKQHLSADVELMPVEVNALTKGFESYISGEEEPEGFKENSNLGYQLYREKQMAHMYQVAQENKVREKAFLEELPNENPGILKTASGLYYEIIDAGDESIKPKLTDKVVVDYKGTLSDGTEFDSSYARGTPATFPVNGVVKGFQEGLQLIGEGGKIKLYIPSELGYGERGAGRRIPAFSTLIFEVEIHDVIDGSVNDSPSDQASEEASASQKKQSSVRKINLKKKSS